MGLLTTQEMALWTQNDLATIASDPFAKEVNDKVSAYVLFLAGHPLWTRADTPLDVQNIILWMFKRTYGNPDQEVSSAVGPISSRVLDEAALGMNLTEAESAILAGYKAQVDDGTGSSDPLWSASIVGGFPTREPVVFLPDDQQVNLGDLEPWAVPYLEPDDVNATTPVI